MTSVFFAKKGVHTMNNKNFLPDFNKLDINERESFIAHATADIIQAMYYSNNRYGLNVLAKNLDTLLERANDCIDCLDMLHKEGDVYSKIYLLLEYMGKDGVTQQFVDGLEELTVHAQECLAKSDGVAPNPDEEREVLKRLRAVMDRKQTSEDNEDN